ncbi:MAG: dCTP deaminase [Dehalococcoidia bacterium]
MILSDVQIHEALDDGRLRISPEPAPRTATIEKPDRPYSRSSVDLRLGSVLRIPQIDEGVIIDPRLGSTAEKLRTLYKREEIPAQGYILDPEHLVLGITEEEVAFALPAEFENKAQGRPCLAARVEGKSTLARFGLIVHLTAPTIQAGYVGQITLEIRNLGKTRILLTRGMPICQLVIEEVNGTPAGGSSQFAGQTDPAGIH